MSDFASSILSQVSASMDPMKQAEASIIREHLSTMRTSTQVQKDQLTDKYYEKIESLNDKIATLTNGDPNATNAKQIKAIEDQVASLYADIERVRNF